MRERPKRPKLPTRGRADLSRLRHVSEAEISQTSPAELAELPADFWESAALVVPPPKQAISLRVDEDVLAWFKRQGPRYQSRMNAVLRTFMMRMQTPSKPARRRRAG